MNFPLEEPFYKLLYWFINTPGIGGALVFIISGAIVTAFLGVMRWLVMAAYVGEQVYYTFPTHSLLEDEDQAQSS